jgi:hypothetical protein
VKVLDADVTHFDRWMPLLMLGTFTAAYPPMYFAQGFLPLRLAMLGAAAIVHLIIAWRTSAIMPLRLALVGVVLPAAAIMTLTLICAVAPQLQGILLTIGAMALFILTMLLMTRIQTDNDRPPQMATAAVA